MSDAMDALKRAREAYDRAHPHRPALDEELVETAEELPPPVVEEMAEQLPLGPYDDEPVAVTAAREEAIQRADRPPTADWKAHAHETIRRTALRLEYLTSEDVWDTGLQPPDAGSADGDALGPAMRRARAAKLIEPTDRTDTRTNRPQRHNNPKRVWRSLIYRQPRGATWEPGQD